MTIDRCNNFVRDDMLHTCRSL